MEERKVKGIYNIASELAVFVYNIEYGIEDTVIWAFSDKPNDIKTSIIDYDYEDDYGPLAEARPYFMADDVKVYLDEVMKTDYPSIEKKDETIEKLEEIDESNSLDQKVKEYMLKKYPEEEDFIVDMPEDITFNDILNKMLQGEDIYEVIQCFDSVVREKIFQTLSDITGYDYDYFYYLWLKGPEDETYLKFKK